MLARIVLCVLLGLVSYEPKPEKPTLAPSRGMSLYVYQGTFQLPHWWKAADQPVIPVSWYCVRTEGQPSGPTPSCEVADPWGNPETVSPQLELVREVPLRELIDRARREAKQVTEPIPCFPGEYSGDGAW